MTPSSQRRSETLKASPRMFENDVLDKLSRVHPAVPVVLFLPAIAILFVLGVDRLGLVAVAWAAAGYVFWTLLEYWLHRIVFHWEPEKGLGAKLHWIIHGVHHDHPNDPMRLVMPPSVSVPLALAFYGSFLIVLGSGRAMAFGSGFLAGYLVYDMTHFYLHHRVPTSVLGKRLREHHMRHHFQDDTRGFGVSSPVWDRVFGTEPRGRSEQAATHEVAH
ncbi:MAG: sterol desaturase family protein [Solirubrobacteraceae bacterium]|nr:sterol desaturase family protein [Solirubrobacteraceae bacterium]